MPEATSPISFRIPVSLKKDLKKAAAADERSQASFVIRALRAALAKGAK